MIFFDEYFRTGIKMKSFETSSVYDFLWSKDELEKKEVKSKVFTVKQYVVFSAVGRSENQETISNVVGIICPPG